MNVGRGEKKLYYICVYISNKFIPPQMGAYHTLLLEMNRQFTLEKQDWDSIALERIGLCSNQI